MSDRQRNHNPELCTKATDKAMPESDHSALSEPAVPQDARLDETLSCAEPGTAPDFDQLLTLAMDVSEEFNDIEPECQQLITRLRNLEYMQQAARALGITDRKQPLPEQLGQFVLLESLGGGGMGEVFRARHARLNRIHAVKVLHSHRLEDEQAVARFQQEMRAIGQLNHPNIVSALHADEANGIPYLVMEFIEGESLADLVRRLRRENQQLPVSVACELVRQAAVGIHYAHTQGILHRDLKPANIMLDRQNRVRILDLGLARITDSDDPADAAAAHGLTSENQLLGTPDFMAPEQLRGGWTVDARTDVYGLGATLFYLLAGRVIYPSDGSTPILVRALQILNDPVPDIRLLRPEVPESIARLLNRCLMKSPDKRFQTAEQLAAELEQFSTSHTDLVAPNLPPTLAPSLAPGETTGGRRRPPRSGWLNAVAGLGVFAIMAGIIFRLSLPGEGQLIIESSDPDISVSVSHVAGPEVERLEVHQGINKAVMLRIGTWEVTIDGGDGEEFLISPNRFEIGGENPTIVRVERQGKPVSSIPAAESLPSETVRAAQPGRKPESRAAPMSAQAAIIPSLRTDERAWVPGSLDRIREGLVPQPAVVDELFDWQMHVIREPSGTGPLDHRHVSHLRTQGDLLASITDFGGIVLNVALGHVAQIIPAREQSPWQFVSFSPSGEKLLLVSQYGIIVEIRSAEGRLLSTWKNSIQHHSPHAWFSDNQRLVMTRDASLVVVDLRGVVQAELPLKATQAPVRRVIVCDDDQTLLYLTSDGVVRQWIPATGLQSNILTLPVPRRDLLPDIWLSPDENRILTFSHQDEDAIHSRLWDRKGNQRATSERWIKRPSWSPDGRFLVDNNQTILDATTLELIRTLELPATDVLNKASLTPYWIREDGILFCSQHGRRHESIVCFGAIRRFHPAGRLLTSLDWPQPLGPASVTFNAGPEESLRSFHASAVTPNAISKWSAEGQLENLKWAESYSFQSSSDAAAWNRHSGDILVQDSYTLDWLDSNGRRLRSWQPHQGTSPRWSPDGRRVTVLISGDQGTCVATYGAAEEPEWRSNSVNGFASIPAWSPDSRWLSWSTTDIATDRHQLHVADFALPEVKVRDIELLDGHRGYLRPVFSPDSRSLALFRGEPQNPDQTAVFVLKLPEFQELRLQLPLRVENRPDVVWADDSQTFVAAALLQLTPDSKIVRLGSFDTWQSRGGFVAFLDQNRLLTFDGSRGIVRKATGEIEDQFGFCSHPLPGHLDHNQAITQRHHQLALIGASHAHSRPVSVSMIDLSVPNVRWTALIFDDGQAVSFNAAGALLQAPGDINRYVAHSIAYPGGRTVAVTRDELHQRIAANADQKTLLWAHDIFAEMTGEDTNQPLTIDSQQINDLPAIDSVQYMSLSKLLEISDRELTQLSRFIGLKQLDLSETPVVNLPDLTGLSHLVTLNLSGTKVVNIGSLGQMSQLRSLDLSATDITNEAAVWIASLTALERLSLNDTAIDQFGLLDLRSLKQLKRLSLIGVKVSVVDLQSLRDAMPDCEILTEESDRQR